MHAHLAQLHSIPSLLEEAPQPRRADSGLVAWLIPPRHQLLLGDEEDQCMLWAPAKCHTVLFSIESLEKNFFKVFLGHCLRSQIFLESFFFFQQKFAVPCTLSFPVPNRAPVSIKLVFWGFTFTPMITSLPLLLPDLFSFRHLLLIYYNIPITYTHTHTFLSPFLQVWLYYLGWDQCSVYVVMAM